MLTGLAVLGLVAFNVLLLAALRRADAPLVGTVIGAAPLGLALLGPLLRGDRPAIRLVAAAGVSAWLITRAAGMPPVSLASARTARRW